MEKIQSRKNQKAKMDCHEKARRDTKTFLREFIFVPSRASSWLHRLAFLGGQTADVRATGINSPHENQSEKNQLRRQSGEGQKLFRRRPTARGAAGRRHGSHRRL